MLRVLFPFVFSPCCSYESLSISTVLRAFVVMLSICFGSRVRPSFCGFMFMRSIFE